MESTKRVKVFAIVTSVFLTIFLALLTLAVCAPKGFGQWFVDNLQELTSETSKIYSTKEFYSVLLKVSGFGTLILFLCNQIFLYIYASKNCKTIKTIVEKPKKKVTSKEVAKKIKAVAEDTKVVTEASAEALKTTGTNMTVAKSATDDFIAKLRANLKGR